MQRILVAVLVLVTISLASTTAVAQSAGHHFQQGRQLIESNCADCMGSTKEALKKGVAEVSRAVEMGYGDKVAAYKLLADAYNTLAVVYSEPGSQEEKAYSDARQDMYLRLLELDPQNAQFKYEYAITLNDNAKQIAALQDVLKLDPKYADAHFAIGMLLTRTGQVDEGIVELKKAVQLADVERSKMFGKRLIDILNGLGRDEEAKQIFEELKKERKP